MKQEAQVWMASKEVADKLDVHVRTLRNWLEMFVPVTERQKNPQGHYLISENGFKLLKEVKERKDAGNSSLRDIQREMMEEGLLSLKMLTDAESPECTEESEFANTLALTSAVREIESSVQETLFQFQQELVHLSAMQQMQSTILNKIADIEERQESLRLEIRRVMFEMDLIQQQMTRRKQRLARHQTRWSLNPFRWFSRGGQRLSVE